MTGRVVSVKNKNTATVLVERVAVSPLYKKTFIRSKKYQAEDSLGVKEGDVVEIINCRPISGRKHWNITKIMGKSLAEITEEKLKASAEAAISEVMPEPENSENSDIRSSETSGSLREASIPSPSDALKNRKSKNKKEGK